MGEFLSEILAFPTVVFTGSLALAALYWAVAAVGGVGIDLLDSVSGDAVEGALDGLDADAGGADGDAHGSALLGLSQVPLTISLSLLSLFGWLVSFFGMRFVKGVSPTVGVGGPMLVGVVGIGVGIVAAAAGLGLTLIAIRPLRRVFDLVPARGRASFVGSSCTITSGRVDAGFGHADVPDGGSWMRVEVRCAEPNGLKSGDAALLDRWDAANDVYWVTPAAVPAQAEGGGDAPVSGSERS